MAVSIFDENTTHDGSVYTPFDDSKKANITFAARQTVLAVTSGINTLPIDQYRQGIEISTEKHRHTGGGPKIWSGNVKGFTRVHTFGQASSFTLSTETIAFEELPKFNPVSYIELGLSYPFPIVFNDGPLQQKETSIQPFSLGIKNDIEGAEKSFSIKASLEDGNQDPAYINGRTTRVEQFIPYKTDSTNYEPFLDDGQEYWSTNPWIDNVIPWFNVSFKSGTVDIKTDVGELYQIDAPAETRFTSGVFDGDLAWKFVSASVNFNTQSLTIYDERFVDFFVSESYTIQTVYYQDRTPDGGVQRIFTLNGDSIAGGADNQLGSLSINHDDNRWVYIWNYDDETPQNTGNSPVDSLRTDAWNHIAITVDPISEKSASYSLYTNGVYHRTVTAHRPNSGSNSHYLNIGRFSRYQEPDPSSPFGGNNPGGALDSIKATKGVMTAEQVYEEYRKAITEKYGVGYVRVEAFLYPDEGVIKPYTDLGNIEIVNQVSTTDNNLISALTNASMSLNLNDDIRQSRTQKSATAGTDVYGPDSARTGTDSITFRGLVRGS